MRAPEFWRGDGVAARALTRRRSWPAPSRRSAKPVRVVPGRTSVTATPLPRSSTRSASVSRSSAALAAA